MRCVIFVGFLVACGAPDAGSQQPDAAGPPVSFHTDVAPLVDHCGGELCHGGVGLSWPYASLVDQPANECSDHVLVTPGDPGHSYLIAKLTGTGMCSGARMPKGGSPLSSTDLDTIERWVAQGALNN